MGDCSTVSAATTPFDGDASLAVAEQGGIDQRRSRGVEDRHECHIDGVSTTDIRNHRVCRGREALILRAVLKDSAAAQCGGFGACYVSLSRTVNRNAGAPCRTDA